MEPDGSDIIPLSFHETGEYDPSIANDGRVVYSRWDYFDRAGRGPMNFWLCYPDGRDPRSPHGNYLPGNLFDGASPAYYRGPEYRSVQNGPPRSEMSIRAIPDSSRYVAVAGQQHYAGVGTLILIDPSKPNDYLQTQITRLTPEAFEVGEFQLGWNDIWSTPWPLSEDFYLVNKYESIGILDRFGSFEAIYRMERADGLNRNREPFTITACWGTPNPITIPAKEEEYDGFTMRYRPVCPMPLKKPRPPVHSAQTFSLRRDAGYRATSRNDFGDERV